MVKEPRCPYCVLSDDFMPMRATGDGCFACVKCGHVAIPDNKVFQCLCTHCGAMRAFKPAGSRWWSEQRVS